MATTSTIGTSSRNYSTITLWHAAFANGGWIGECYNDTEFNETPSIGGTSGVNYEILRPATGLSPFDTANPLTYDATKGVGLTNAGNYSTTLTISSYCTVQRMQVRQTGAGNSNMAVSTSNGGTGVVLDRSLFLNTNTGNSNPTYLRGSTTVTNSVIIVYAGHGVSIGYGGGNSHVFANTTVVAPSDKTHANYAFHYNAGTVSITNCAGFGFTSGFCDSSAPTGTNNATDAASIGFTSSGSLTSQTYANQFTGTASTAMDFRLKSGNSLDGAGATDTTDIPAAIDIFGTAR